MIMIVSWHIVVLFEPDHNSRASGSKLKINKPKIFEMKEGNNLIRSLIDKIKVVDSEIDKLVKEV